MSVIRKELGLENIPSGLRVGGILAFSADRMPLMLLRAFLDPFLMNAEFVGSAEFQNLSAYEYRIKVG